MKAFALTLIFLFTVLNSAESRAAWGENFARTIPIQHLGQEDDATLNHLGNLTDRILRPNADALFIAIGASPLVIAADLEARGAHVVRLPLSGIGQALELDLTHDQDFLRAYLDSFLKAALALQPARVVVLDYAKTGYTLKALPALLKGYLSMQGLTTARLRYVAFSGSPSFRNAPGFARRIRLSRRLEERFGATINVAFVSTYSFDYLRTSQRYSLNEWLHWAAAQTARTPDQWSDLIAQKQRDLALPEGEAAYREAVAIFAARHTQRVGFADRCRRWLTGV